MRPPTAIRRAFTLIEVLVVVGIIAILLGISVPVLQSVRSAASATGCKSNLGSLGVFYEMHASDNNGDWPTMAQPVELGPVHYSWGSNGIRMFAVDQIDFWGFPLRNYVGGGSHDADRASGGTADADKTMSPAVLLAIETMSCPNVAGPVMDDFADSGGVGFAVPDVVLSRSFSHSPALFTRPSSWNDPELPPDVNLNHSRVKHAHTTNPSRKTNLIESFPYHWSGRGSSLTYATGTMKFNVLACDGHVEVRTPNGAAPSMGFLSTTSTQYSGKPIPLLTTIRGARGVDW